MTPSQPRRNTPLGHATDLPRSDRADPRTAHPAPGRLTTPPAGSRPLRPCPHTPPHTHGTRVAYVKDRCRCAPCTAANTREERRRVKTAAYGRSPGYVDATAARRHLEQLLAAGISLRRLSRLSGVPHGSLARLRYGDHRGPARRIRPTTETAILTVPATPHAAAPGARVDATGTRRRLQALIARGWTEAALARRAGMNRSALARLLTATAVTRATADRIRVLYQRTWTAEPPAHTRQERATAGRARAIAAARGWVAALGWDNIDTDIDVDMDPDPAQLAADPEPTPLTLHARSLRTPAHRGGPVTPKGPRMGFEDLDEVAIERAMYGERLPLNPAERREAVRRLTDRGHSVRQIADRLHLTPRAVTRLRSTTRTAA